MKRIIPILIILLGLWSCQSEVVKYGNQYQRNGQLASLEKAVALLQAETDTAVIRKILGTPIDMGFDFRYLTEKTGDNGCVIGAVFHIDGSGKVDDRWIGEICE